MKRFFPLALALLLPFGAAQTTPSTDRTVTGPGGYEYTPGMTPEQQQQLKNHLDKQLATPKLVSRSAQAAVTAILNEQGRISGLVGPLPRELGEALNRAAIRIPVQLVLGGSAANTSGLNRVKRVLVNASAPTTMIATSEYLITVDASGIAVYQTAFMASQVHQNVQQLVDTFAKKP